MTTKDDLRSWLFARLAELIGVPAASITGAESVDELGADSIVVARVTEELRERLGASLPPTLFYDAASLDALLRRLPAAGPAPAAAARIVVAASFTAEPLDEPLRHVLDRAGLPAAVALAPYHQVVQQLFDPAEGFGGQPAAAHLVLLRIEDWFRHAGGRPAPGAAAAVTAELAAALAAARDRLKGPLVVALCPHGPGLGAPDADADRDLAAAVGGIAGVDLLDLRDIGDAHHDVVRDRVGHIPYTAAGYADLALRIGRRLHGLLRPAAKVIVADCDNTLWRGVVGEDGVEGVAVEPGHRALQDFLLERKAAGQLLALASKNVEDDVWAVFEARADMRLARRDVAAARIDWQPKPDNLRALAAELDLGLDSFVFLDDSPAECAAVAASLPEVTVVQLPADPESFAPFLRAHWAFDAGAVTAEDRRRTELYAVARERRDARARAASFEDYLASLGIAVSISPLGAADLPRAAQLTQRTNQFNTTTLRRSEAELADLVGASPPRALKVEVRDRFGDYGFVGLLTLRWAGALCEVDSFMLSCRVLGRRVEHAVLRHAADLAAAAGASRFAVLFVPSPRNQPARAFLRSVAGPVAEGAEGLDLDPRAVGALLERARPDAAEAAEQPGEAPSAPRSAAPSAGLSWIAGLAGDGAALERALASRVGLRPALEQPFLAPRDPLQGEIAKAWCAVLRLDRVGIEDDFYLLGGDSLAGAELAARLQEMGLPDDVGLGVADRPTVAGLAALVERRREGHLPVSGPTVASLNAMAELPADVGLAIAAAARSGAPAAARTYLLTGATGYVGAYLSAELLQRPGVRLVCHVRAGDADEGAARVRRNLERYGLWRPDFAPRIAAAVGRLDAPRLGLEPRVHDRLAAEVDAVIHNGANVNFVFPFSHLRGANVDGSAEALRFALHGRPKPLHFISTLGVLMSGYARDHVIREDEELDHSEDLPNGYEQTKWVADKMMWRAMRAGYPVAIYRLGMLSGVSTTGVYHKLNEFLPSFLKGCVQLGSFPHLDSKVEMVPVDVTARILGRVIGDARAIGRVFHMNHPAPLEDGDFMATIRGFGYPLRYMPYDVWKRELIGSGAALRSNALYPFLDFMRSLQAHQTRIPEMDMANTLALAGDEVRACPDQETLLRRYFDHFADIGYLRGPPGELGFRRAG